MKKAVSFLIVALLLSSLMIPGVFAEAATTIVESTSTNDLLGPDLVYVSDEFWSYGYVDSEKSICMAVDLQNNIGTGSIVWEKDPTKIYSYSFACDDSNQNPFNRIFWTSFERAIFDNAENWTVFEKSFAEEVIPRGQASVTSEGYLIPELLISQYGPQYSALYKDSRTVNGISFEIRETFEYGYDAPDIKNIYVGQTITEVVSDVLSVATLFFPTTPALNAFVFAFVQEYIGNEVQAAGQILVYTIEMDRYRYTIATQGNANFPYTVVDEFSWCTALFYTNTSYYSLSDVHFREYIPSETFFNSYDLQYEAAYDEYLIYGLQ